VVPSPAILGLQQFAVDDVEIGAAHAARFNREQDFAVRGLRNRQLPQNERCLRPIEHHRAHD
jgi:hypothetical protein